MGTQRSTTTRRQPTLALDGKKLQDARLRKGWSQVQLAYALGVSQSTISCWESEHKSPAVAVLVLPVIAEALGVTVSKITRRVEAVAA